MEFMTFAEMVKANAKEKGPLEVNLYFGGTEVDDAQTYWGVLHLDVPGEYRRSINSRETKDGWEFEEEVYHVLAPRIVADVWMLMILGERETVFGPALVGMMLEEREANSYPEFGEGEIVTLWIHKPNN